MAVTLKEVVEVAEKLQAYKKFNRIEYYDPYGFQKAFHHARKGEVYPSGCYEIGDGEVSDERCLICANQIGKSTAAAYETAFHATGIYPDWWDGKRFSKPVTIVVAGKRNESVRDVPQKELFGDPFDESLLGTGTIPKHLIMKPVRKAGVPNAFAAVPIKHITGGRSIIRLMAFEQGPDAFMGAKYQVAWLDEEPPSDVLSQIKRAMLAQKEKTIYMTFTPEEGFTEVVDQFLEDMKPWQALVRATWDDAPHMTPEKREEHLSQFPVHERAMRSTGEPMAGKGLVFTIPDEKIMVDPFPIPIHWPRICGIDFGDDHPFAAVWMAFDRDSGTSYVYDCYRERKVQPPIHAQAIKNRSNWIPIVWPHDGLQEDPKSSTTLADYYRDDLGLTTMRSEKFSNPPAPGQKEGQGGNGVEVGLTCMLTDMETGNFKVFSNLKDWFEEKAQYHRKVNAAGKVKVVDRKDDLMSATRLAYMSQRFATTQPVRRVQNSPMMAVRNW